VSPAFAYLAPLAGALWLVVTFVVWRHEIAH
jgi:hypothetical protein